MTECTGLRCPAALDRRDTDGESLALLPITDIYTTCRDLHAAENSAGAIAMDETLYLMGSISALLLLVGHVGWLLARLLKRAAPDRPELQQVDQVAQLQQDLARQIQAMRSEVGSALEDVHERLDFAERVLAKGRGDRPEDERP